MTNRKLYTTRLEKISNQVSEDPPVGDSPAQRLEMMWPLTLDAWAFMGDPNVEHRLQRHVERLVKGEG